jgi:hypothetical protein
MTSCDESGKRPSLSVALSPNTFGSTNSNQQSAKSGLNEHGQMKLMSDLEVTFDKFTLTQLEENKLRIS